MCLLISVLCPLKTSLHQGNASLLSKFPSLEKEISIGESPYGPSVSLWGGVACRLEACGPLNGYGDTLKMLAALSGMFQELGIEHCSKKKKGGGHQCLPRVQNSYYKVERTEIRGHAIVHDSAHFWHTRLERRPIS